MEDIVLSSYNCPSVIKAWNQASWEAKWWVYALVSQSEGLVFKSPEIICQFLKAEKLITPIKNAEDVAIVIKFLAFLGERAAIRMLKKVSYRHRGVDHPINHQTIVDGCKLWYYLYKSEESIDIGRVRCWLTLRNECKRRIVDIECAIPLPVRYPCLEGLCDVNNKWSIHLPQTSAELKNWGIILHNCLGSYAKSIKKGSRDILGIKIQGSLKYCIEIRNGYITQFSGASNSDVPGDVKDSVETVLSMFFGTLL